VVSAFHAGSELLKHIKAKRRKARAAQAQQEFEEKQLQDSLVSGEQQIGFRYTQDVREMGDVVRVGDSKSRNRSVIRTCIDVLSNRPPTAHACRYHVTGTTPVCTVSLLLTQTREKLSKACKWLRNTRQRF
jgi:hypothetical protein